MNPNHRLHITTPSELHLYRNIPVITVGILTRPEIRVVLHGAFRSLKRGSIFRGECTVRISAEKIAIENADASSEETQEILLVPEEEGSSFTIKDVTIGVQFHWERNEDQRFVGSLKLVRSGNAIVVVNVVSIEDYLTSVISSEMSAASSLQLLKAHAITSRSWLLAQLEKSKAMKKAGNPLHVAHVETEAERVRWYDREDHDLFDVCADDHCQRYQGVTKAFSASVTDAVNATCGQVVMSGSEICDARFSKSCGGVTEPFETVWEPVPHPYLVAIQDAPSAAANVIPDLTVEEDAERWIRGNPSAFCNTTDRKILAQILPDFDQETVDFYRWNVDYTQDELSQIIRERSGIDFGEIVDLVPVARGKSARLISLKIIGTKKTFTIGKELEIRRTLSRSHLYSSAIVFEKSDIQNGIPSRIRIYGAGWGHGVGFCQIGAAMMGEKGYSHENILLHYFPNTEIKKLY